MAVPGMTRPRGLPDAVESSTLDLRRDPALAILGRIPAAHVRPPLTPVSDYERHRIRLALRAAGLL